LKSALLPHKLVALALLSTLLFVSVARASEAHADRLSRFHGKLKVTATYQPKNNRTLCEMRDKRIKKNASDSSLRHSHWRMKGKYSAKDCLEAWLQQ